MPPTFFHGSGDHLVHVDEIAGREVAARDERNVDGDGLCLADTWMLGRDAPHLDAAGPDLLTLGELQLKISLLSWLGVTARWLIGPRRSRSDLDLGDEGSSPFVPARRCLPFATRTSTVPAAFRRAAVVARQQRHDHDADDEERDARDHEQIRSTHKPPPWLRNCRTAWLHRGAARPASPVRLAPVCTSFRIVGIRGHHLYGLIGSFADGPNELVSPVPVGMHRAPRAAWLRWRLCSCSA